MTAPFAGGYESAILQLGFVDAQGIVPSAEVKSFMTLAVYLFDIILAVSYLILLPFVDIEKKLPQINADLRQRQIDAAAARGEEWIAPEELERREQEQAERQHEEDRIRDLQERCAKKGLNFEEENQKYLARQARKAKKKD